ncbi:hypothetical protein JL101_020250 [Skermanella rosea]|uniref:hypothetical protein n=1 Tax=Skermanella rosea TaxID=1817965 RepID=UPI0019314ECF|nr:hypothetical protein [Skermanella rosea]UEM02316.1 hypothetical protein JL101_020250 [Skermanella rosea]
MGIRTLLASASLLLLSALPAQADWDRHGDRWGRQLHSNPYQSHSLKRACDFGNRRACVELGEIIGERRAARRERVWRQDDFGRRHWQAPPHYHRPPPPSVWWRFDVR